MLSEMEEKKNWGGAIRLCRFVKDNSLWACLAAMAIKNGQLNVAEVALAAIEEVSNNDETLTSLKRWINCNTFHI